MKKMRKFDLDEAKAGGKVCTRNGLDVEITSFTSGTLSFPIVARIRDDGRHRCQEVMYTEEGLFGKKKAPMSTT